MTDISGDVVERYEYGDYGLPTILAGEAHPDVLAGTINVGDVVATSAIGNPYLFNGRRYDAESGFYWYRTRYLDPIHPRSLSQTPASPCVSYLLLNGAG